MLSNLCVCEEKREHAPTAGDYLTIPNGVVEDDWARAEDCATGLCSCVFVAGGPVVASLGILCSWARERNADSVTGVGSKTNAVYSTPAFDVADERMLRI